jgi:hypothetical protein
VLKWRHAQRPKERGSRQRMTLLFHLPQSHTRQPNDAVTVLPAHSVERRWGSAQQDAPASLWSRACLEQQLNKTHEYQHKSGGWSQGRRRVQLAGHGCEVDDWARAGHGAGAGAVVAVMTRRAIGADGRTGCLLQKKRTHDNSCEGEREMLPHPAREMARVNKWTRGRANKLKAIYGVKSPIT